MLFVSCRFRPIIAVLLSSVDRQLPNCSYHRLHIPLSLSHSERARQLWLLSIAASPTAGVKYNATCHSCTQHEQTRKEPFRTFLFEFKKFSIEFKRNCQKWDCSWNGFGHSLFTYVWYARQRFGADASPNCVGCWPNRCWNKFEKKSQLFIYSFEPLQSGHWTRENYSRNIFGVQGRRRGCSWIADRSIE